MADSRRVRLEGLLLGTALGDALGLPMEGLDSKVISRRFGALDRFHLLGRTGFVSDDTEQSALVAQSLVRFPRDPARAAQAFGRSLVGWFLRLPWGIGLATLRACLRRMFGFRKSGVWSAGNGAAMRAGVVGVAYADDPVLRRSMGRSLAEVTHLDPRGVEGALYVAEVAAKLCDPTRTVRAAFVESLEVVAESSLREAISSAIDLSDAGAARDVVVAKLGNTGFILHTLPFATWCALAHSASPMDALRSAVQGGGDTDSIAAIVGAWVGTHSGPAGLDPALLAAIHDGPFGPSHLRALAHALDARLDGRDVPTPRYSIAAALVRNLALYPVVLAHGFRRLLPG